MDEIPSNALAVCRNCGVEQHDQLDAICTTCYMAELIPMSVSHFPSSGNQEQDEATAIDIQRTEARLNDNICPNGCSTMNYLSDHERECPVCKFSQWSNVPF
jgi:hypothetical protein